MSFQHKLSCGLREWQGARGSWGSLAEVRSRGKRGWGPQGVGVLSTSYAPLSSLPDPWTLAWARGCPRPSPLTLGETWLSGVGGRGWDGVSAAAAREGLGAGGRAAPGPPAQSRHSSPQRWARGPPTLPVRSWLGPQGGGAQGPRHPRWPRCQACPSCPWTRGELGPAAAEDGQETPPAWLRPLLLPPRPGRDPDRLLPPFRHLNGALAGAGWLSRGGAQDRRVSSRGQAGSRAAPIRRAWAKSSEDSSPGPPAARFRVPRGAVPGDPAFRKVWHPPDPQGWRPGCGLTAAGRRRPSSIRPAVHRWLGWGGLGAGSGESETPLGRAARRVREHACVPERRLQAVSLLLGGPSSTSSECNCVLPTRGTHYAVHLPGPRRSLGL